MSLVEQRVLCYTCSTMEAAAAGEKDDCHGIAENVMFDQMALMDTGAFEVALDIDMLKDTIVDHRLPVQSMLAA